MIEELSWLERGIKGVSMNISRNITVPRGWFDFSKDTYII